MQDQGIIHTLKRYQTLYTHKINVLPIAILMPHSACNCRCVMCDIWKGNKNTKQLSEEDVSSILASLKKLDTKRIVMSGGEALLNKNFFKFCEIIRGRGIKITLLSTGLTVDHHAEKLVQLVDDVIVSLDGDEGTHDQIRNIKGAFSELKKGVQKLKTINPDFPVSARCVIHRLNYKHWDKIISAAMEIGLDQISFLPADVTSDAFNRAELWEKDRQESVLIPKEELPELKAMLNKLSEDFHNLFENKFIAESKEKLQKIYRYYSAHHGLEPFPEKKCNAPWVSAVVEADGTVRPCFFHDSLGSIKSESLDDILNSEKSNAYRKGLDIHNNPTCVKCVCYLNLAPRNKHY
jgi:MoaA/NifB/PqqE/SkfB family radical SAM enzyme